MSIIPFFIPATIVSRRRTAPSGVLKALQRIAGRIEGTERRVLALSQRSERVFKQARSQARPRIVDQIQGWDEDDRFLNLKL